MIHINDCVYLPPNTFPFAIPQNKTDYTVVADERYRDIDQYPELYRKPPGSSIKLSGNDDVQPYQIGLVRLIQKKKSNIVLSILKFYRPENTHWSRDDTFVHDINVLFLTEEEVANIPLDQVEGKCTVRYFNHINNMDEFQLLPDHFYFRKVYDSYNLQLLDPEEDLLDQLFPVDDTEKGKGKRKASNHGDVEPLDTLDVFAGCGGLSEGLHQSGAFRTKWAIEFEPAAAKAYSKNFPDAVVFTDDCNDLLALIIQGKEKDSKGRKLPQRGQVQALVGGPPCQGMLLYLSLFCQDTVA